MVDKMFWTCLMNSHKLNGIILHLMFTTEMKLYKIFFKFFVTVKTISFILVTCHVCHVIKSKCSWHVKMMLSPPTQASIYLRKGNICPKLDTIKILVVIIWLSWLRLHLSIVNNRADRGLCWLRGVRAVFYCDQLHTRIQSHHHHWGSLYCLVFTLIYLICMYLHRHKEYAQACEDIDDMLLMQFNLTCLNSVKHN